MNTSFPLRKIVARTIEETETREGCTARRHIEILECGHRVPGSGSVWICLVSNICFMLIEILPIGTIMDYMIKALTKPLQYMITTSLWYFRREGGARAMALPIGSTPILKGRDAKKFDEKIKQDLQRPTRLVPTPRLEEARKLVMEYAVTSKKRI